MLLKFEYWLKFEYENGRNHKIKMLQNLAFKN